jgi:proline iminopeptidase
MELAQSVRRWLMAYLFKEYPSLLSDQQRRRSRRIIQLLLLLMLVSLPGWAHAITDGFVARPDVKLHYRIHGDKGPVLVILAGGPGGANTMLQPIADHLKDRFRCVMLEQRGTGRSTLDRYDDKTISFDAYIDDIEALREYLGQERLLLLGSSWGMTLAFAYAGAHPNRVTAVATIGSGNLTRELERAWDDNLKMRLSPDQLRKLQELNDRRPDPDEGYVAWFKIVAPAYFFKPEEAAKFSAQVKPGDLNGKIPGLAMRMMRRLEEYVYDRLPRITSPVLLIQGRQDLAPEETAFIVRERVKKAKVVLLNQCGHVPWLDQPQATWKELDAFLAPFLRTEKNHNPPPVAVDSTHAHAC